MTAYIVSPILSRESVCWTLADLDVQRLELLLMLLRWGAFPKAL